MLHYLLSNRNQVGNNCWAIYDKLGALQVTKGPKNIKDQAYQHLS